MTIAKVVATLVRKSGVSADEVTNTFYVRTASESPSQAELGNIATVMEHFYTQISTGGAPLATWLSPVIDRVNSPVHTMSIWTMEDDHDPAVDLGSPDFVRGWVLGGASTSNAAPAEVSAVLTIAADLTDVPEEQGGGGPGDPIVRPKARRRGRIYVGPLSLGVIDQDGSTREAKMYSGFITDLVTIADDTQDELQTNGFRWLVWSGADRVGRNVQSAWVDDAFDTQRRRGEDARSRQMIAF